MRRMSELEARVLQCQKELPGLLEKCRASTKRAETAKKELRETKARVHRYQKAHSTVARAIRTGRLYMQQKEYMAAILELARATGIEKSNATLWYMLAECRLKISQPAAAEEACMMSLKLQPSGAGVALLGRILQERGRHDEAIQCYLSALGPEVMVAKQPAKRDRPRKDQAPAAAKKRRRKRKSSWDYEDDDGDVDFLEAADSGGESEEEATGKKAKKQPKKRVGRTRKAPLAEAKAAAPRKKKSAKEMSPTLENGDADDEDEEDREMLEEKHRSRKQQYEKDSERLLQEVRDLALAEKKTQGRLIEKLKKDITTLSKQAEEGRKKGQKEVDKQVAEKMREYDAKQRNRGGVDAEKVALQKHIEELEAQFASYKRSTGPDDVVTVNAAAVTAATAAKNSEAMIQLAQANKLLELYRVVTSTDIRLIEAADDDDQDDDCTEVVCTTTDSATGNNFEFELAVPTITSSEIEYLPSEKPPTNLKVPSYLREELSFNRSEMTKFIRSVLDVVIRKKKV
ncbi:hypothetical protein BBO99_00004498 [Phytophthora kernoviae]|uniref:Uncharacterized protein n=2 Tax=Phytophthora kernoviae TaxID=325452 RepID=A0A3R7G2U4_9STRA|nr:hypothetical protein G195_004993 [Phytophthora kernoviae 00238/432]KAG2525506.1 hypothetical protein JM16_004384 [Phytophthora kernoviae]KAG2527245.1 hypothetical protein JM18_003919 [Phytophthora kernoviae]RLN21006.1 hypothetical protein BBI17_004690 [Phytophthora kernoviae]RLN80418.1 hypothetical protein BBO99_00004498 [Phytophthora kernoviae]